MLILVAEDNSADVQLVKVALEEHSVAHTLHVVCDGAGVMEFFDRTDSESDSPCPELVLLDMHLPKSSGTEILARVRRSPRCGDVPVIVMSSLASPEDFAEISRLGATRYFEKPLSLDGFLKLGALIKQILASDSPHSMKAQPSTC